MQWIAVKAVFEHEEPELAAEIIATAFFEQDLKGVVIENPAIELPEGAFTDDDLVFPDETAVSSYLPETEELPAKIEGLRIALDELALSAGFKYELQFETLDERDWAEAWKEHFYPVRLSERIVVKPSWREFDASPADIVLEIDPGMAFGTGTHPTTALCVRLIEEYMGMGTSFLDIGCGSGILMLAAASLGARPVLGVDNDPVAVAVTCENMALNDISAGQYQAICGNLANDVHQQFSLVAANILAPAIKELLPEMAQVLQPGGVAIFSGLLNRDRAIMEQAVADAGFEILQTPVEQDWIAIAARLR